MRLETITAPSAAPLLLAEVRDHLRIDGGYEDSALSGFITASVQAVEAYAGLVCMQRQANIYIDYTCKGSGPGCWNGVADGPVPTTQTAYIALPLRPLVSVDAVGFTPNGGDETLLDAQSYSTALGLDAGLKLMSAPSQNGTLRIAVTAGFGATWNTVPADIRHALLLYVTCLYTKRGEEMTGPQSMLRQCGAEALLLPYRRVRL